MPPIRKHQPVYNNHRIFDPWNSSSTGHQQGESSTGTAWRRTREEKLGVQFSSHSHSHPSSCLSGDGEWVWLNGALENEDRSGSRRGSGSGKEKGQKDIRDMFLVGKTFSSHSQSSRPNGSLLSGSGDRKTTPTPTPSGLSSDTIITTTTKTENHDESKKDTPQTKDKDNNPPQIFTNLTIHLNAVSSPLISDHALRQLLVAHGASLALSVSRRVTHIIVGRPNTVSPSPSSSSSSTGRSRSRTITGAGGGLAAGKLQKEIAKAGCRAFRVVGVEWVLESIKAGKRLSEARFAMDIAGRGQRSVLAFV